MMKKLHIFAGAVLAGAAIAVGGILYLSVEPKALGAVLFTVGLYTICAHGLMLYTGKVGYALDGGLSYLADLAIIWAGNLLGTFACARLAAATRLGPALYSSAVRLCGPKLTDSLPSLFILGVFCGLLMFSAVDGYKRKGEPLILFACVAAFILCGFEHCVADMFYFSMARAWSPSAWAAIAAISLGNSAGGLLIPLAGKLKKE